MTVSDRIIVMDGGRIIAEGDPRTVRRNPPSSRRTSADAAAATGRGRNDRDALALDAVDVYDGPFQALRGVTIEVGEGEIVSLLGGNASGKSTTMKTILGLIRVVGDDHVRRRRSDPQPDGQANPRGHRERPRGETRVPADDRR